MKRRTFAGLLAAFACSFASMASGADALLFERGSKTVVVRGNPEDVTAMMYRYQDALWPAWRQEAPSRVTDSYELHERRIQQTGKVELYAGCDITRRAFVTAIRD